jgi:polyisoprenoid-binding protein YceI
MKMRILPAAALVLALAVPALAAPAPPSKDPTTASAGTYKLDPRHTSVIARIGHAGGFSFSTFRFGGTGGTLTWDPERIEASRLEVTVDPASIMTPVQGFADELSKAPYLDAARFPQARFVSTAIRRTGPTTGQITGDFTFMGQTRPIVLEGELVGAGRNGRGVDTMGFSGRGRFKRSDFGFTAFVGPIGDEVELLIDTEFNKS